MADLILRDQLLPLPDQGRDFIIGRQEDCDLRLEGKLISRKHAKLSRIDGRTWIEDLGSINGVKIAGTRINGRHPLNDGEYITIGEHTLQFSDPSQPVARPAGTASPDQFEGTFFAPAPPPPQPPKPSTQHIPAYPTPRPGAPGSGAGSLGIGHDPTVIVRDDKSGPRPAANPPPSPAQGFDQMTFPPMAAPAKPQGAAGGQIGPKTTVPERPIPYNPQPPALPPLPRLQPAAPESPLDSPVIRWLILAVIAGILGLIIAVSAKYLLLR